MDDTTASIHPDFWRRLLHRWLVQYNPLYLLSAALVLGGITLISRGLAHESTLYGQLGVAVIAEVYAFSLIAGAALLTRIGLRRPAVMLALLTVLYQGDLTLHLETCAYLGGVGVAASLGWLALFGAKLYALAWAVRLRLSPSTVALPSLGALGFVVLPHVLPLIDASSRTSLIMLWVFAFLAAGLWTTRPVRSTVSLDAWGQTVLRRALRATWLLWAVLALCHVLFWMSESELPIAALLAVAPLLATRWLRREFAVWCAVCATLLFVAVASPALLSTTAFLAAVTFGLRALRAPSQATPHATSPAPTPYRTSANDAPPPIRPAPAATFAAATQPALLRLCAGAATALYLAAWTRGWTAGPLPEHIAALDVLLSALLAFAALRRGVYLAWLPLGLMHLHNAIQLQLITAPRTTLQWGVCTVSIGFTLLLVSLLVSWRLRRHLQTG